MKGVPEEQKFHFTIKISIGLTSYSANTWLIYLWLHLIYLSLYLKFVSKDIASDVFFNMLNYILSIIDTKFNRREKIIV